MTRPGGEFDLIAGLRAREGGEPPAWLHRGIGDDAAVLTPPPGAGWQLMVSADTVVDGTHFHLAECGPVAAGRKAVAAALSDVAAMGAGERGWTLASVTFDRDGERAWREALLHSIQSTAARHGHPLIGGDITAGVAVPTSITIMVAAWSRHPVTRGGARPGDLLLVTGKIGGSLQSGRHLTFEPRLELARELCARLPVSAMIDISDGLTADLGHLCEESGVGALIHGTAVPLAPDAPPDLLAAMAEGEDYELLLTVPGSLAPQLPAELLGVPLTVVGRIRAEPGLRLQLPDRDATIPLPPAGHDHLTPPGPGSAPCS